MSNIKDKTRKESGEANIVDSSNLRWPEDKYDLEDVCRAAIQVSESSQGMFHLMGRATSMNTEERGVYVFNQPVTTSNTSDFTVVIVTVGSASGSLKAEPKECLTGEGQVLSKGLRA